MQALARVCIREARYVGMARKQNGGYNASISIQTPIFHLVVNSTRLKTVRSPRWCCPNSTMAPRLFENVVKVTNLEVVKIEFRHLPFSSFFLQPAYSALCRDAWSISYSQSCYHCVLPPSASAPIPASLRHTTRWR